MNYLINLALFGTVLTIPNQIDYLGALDYSASLNRPVAIYPQDQPIKNPASSYKRRLEYIDEFPEMENYCRSLGSSRCQIEK